jgi:hypothetical protein
VHDLPPVPPARIAIPKLIRRPDQTIQPRTEIHTPHPHNRPPPRQPRHHHVTIVATTVNRSHTIDDTSSDQPSTSSRPANTPHRRPHRDLTNFSQQGVLPPLAKPTRPLPKLPKSLRTLLGPRTCLPPKSYAGSTLLLRYWGGAWSTLHYPLQHHRTAAQTEIPDTMVRRGSTVRVRQRASESQQMAFFGCLDTRRRFPEAPKTCPRNLSPTPRQTSTFGLNARFECHRAAPLTRGTPCGPCRRFRSSRALGGVRSALAHASAGPSAARRLFECRAGGDSAARRGMRPAPSLSTRTRSRRAQEAAAPAECLDTQPLLEEIEERAVMAEKPSGRARDAVRDHSVTPLMNDQSRRTSRVSSAVVRA